MSNWVATPLDGPDDPRHGTANGYRHHCRCGDCSMAEVIRREEYADRKYPDRKRRGPYKRKFQPVDVPIERLRTGVQKITGEISQAQLDKVMEENKEQIEASIIEGEDFLASPDLRAKLEDWRANHTPQSFLHRTRMDMILDNIDQYKQMDTWLMGFVSPLWRQTEAKAFYSHPCYLCNKDIRAGMLVSAITLNPRAKPSEHQRRWCHRVCQVKILDAMYPDAGFGVVARRKVELDPVDPIDPN